MLKVEHSIDYLKKGKSSSEASEEVQHAKQITLQRKTLRFKRSDDNPELPENFEVGQAVADGNCFFDSFRQGLEQQLGIKVTVAQLRQYCKEFAQNNPPEWFINAIANNHDNSGAVRNETPASYVRNILNSDRWGDPDIEGRILCKKYNVKLHVVERQVVNGEEIWVNQIVDNEGSRSVDNVDYNEENTIHIINRGNAHFESILSTQEIRHNKQQPPDPSDYDDEITSEEELINIIKSRDSEEEKLAKIKRLFEKEPKPDINFQDKDNDTPLHIAIRKKELKVIEWLVKNGAKIDIKNSRGRTQLEVTQHLDRQDIVEVLKSHIQPSLQVSVERPSTQQKRTRTDSKEDKSEDSNPKRPRISLQAAEESRGRKRTKNEESELGADQVKKLKTSEGYPASGLKHTLHGNVYQLKLLMLFLKRGLNKSYSFLLATEMDAAEKFDDLVFKYESERKDGRVYRFLQAKHKQDESKKISVNDLLTEKDEDFSLQKYFLSYRKIKRNPEFNDQSDELKDFIICTNIDLGHDLQNSFERVEDDIDDIIDIKVENNSKEPKRLKFRKGGSLTKESLTSIFVEVSDLKRLAKKLAEYVFSNNNNDKTIGLKDDLLKKYHGALAERVIDIQIKKFKEDFVSGSSNLPKEVKEFRKVLLEKSRLSEEDFKRDLKTKNLKISGTFGKVLKLEENPQIKSSNKSPNPSQELGKHVANLIAKEKIGTSIKIEQRANIIKENIAKLIGHVFVETEDGKKKFRQGFLNGDTLLGNLNDFREGLKTGLLKGIQFSHLGQYEFEINVHTCTEKDYEEYKKDKYYFELPIPNDKIRDEEIDDFLDKLVFAVNQPNEVELGEIIKNELGKEFNTIDRKNVYGRFLEKILDWMKDKEGKFFTHEEGKTFFEEIKKEILGAIWIGVRDSVELFTGREKELERLDEVLRINQGQDKVTVISQVTSISGLGGIGKSELARKYAYEYGHHYNNNVIWINAENSETMKNSFLSVARDDRLGIPIKGIDGEEKEIESIVKEVYSFFVRGERKSLFIFDNAEKYKTQPKDGSKDVGIDRFLPSVAPTNKPYILITSRNQKWGSIRVIPLNIFTEAEAIKFIKKALMIEQDKDVADLAEKLERFPLALQQAVAYIKQTDEEVKNVDPKREFTIKNYLKEYQEKARELLNFSFPDDSNDLYTKTTFTTWKVTIDEIKENKEYGQQTLEILNIIAYCAPDNIPTKIFLKLEEYDERKLGATVQLLKQYSMVNLEKGILSVHRLVQEVTRINLKDREKEVLRKALELFQGDSSQINLFDDNFRLNNVDHAISVWRYANNHKELVREFSSLPVLIVSELNASLRYQEAYLFGSNALKLLEKILGDNHPSVLSMMNNIASVLYTQGKDDDALEIYRKLNKKTDIINKLTMSKVVFFDTNIGLILNRKGKHDEALKIFSHLYSLVKEGKINSDGSIEHNIGLTLSEQGKLNDAMEMFKNALKQKEEVLGPDHESTLNTKNSIAAVLERQGKYEDVLKMHWKIYEKRKKNLGPNHPNTLTTYGNIALSLTKLSRYDEALKIANEVEKEREKLFPNHPRTLKGKLLIVRILDAQGKYDKALEKCKEVYEKRKEVLEPNHPDTLTTLDAWYGLALKFAKQRKYDKALKELNEVLEERKRILKPNHPDILKTEDAISKVRRARDNGADINFKIMDRELFSAAQKGQLEVVNELLSKGVGVNVQTADEGLTPLHFAAQNDHARVVEKLLEGEADVNAKDINGSTALHIAAHRNYLDVVNALLKGDADVNCYDNALFRPLHFAAQEGHTKIVELLLKNGADIEATNVDGLTSLHIAAYYKHLDVVKILLEGGANIDAVNKHNMIPDFINKVLLSTKQLPNAIRRKHNKSDVQRLLEDGAVINYFSDTSRLTSLHYAVSGGNLDIVVLLLGKKPDVNVADEDGWTPLHYTAQDGHLDIVKLLLDHRADPTVQNSDRKTPLDLAQEKSSQNPQVYQEIIKILTESINQQQKTDPINQGGEVSSEECLPGPSSGNRRKREAEGKCLFTWEGVDEFNEEKDEKRDFDKIKIDSEKFVSYIKDLSKEKQSQLIQLASEVKVTGESQSLVNKLISNQKVMSHLSRVGRISGMTMHGMMAKNVLVDFLNGDYQGVAVNVGFIAGGQGFAKVAEAASLKGLKLASEGKLLLGRSLRAASPFLARGTSAFVVYDLVNQVKAFKNGTEEALVGIVGDSIYLGVDAAEIGIEIAEAFEVLEGVSSVTGPIGATIGAVVFVGTDIYMAVKRVDKIDQIIHLTGKEKFVEGLRAFIGMQPEKHIEELMEEKQVSNQLVKQGLEYLQQHSDIQSYVFPTGKSVVDSCRDVPYQKSICSGGFNWCSARRTVTRYTEKCTTKFEVDLDSTVLLDRKRTDIRWSRARPDNPSNGKLFCLPKGNDKPAPSYGSYLCENAIGLSVNKTGSHTLISLGEGKDYAKGFLNNPNIFVVNNGSKKYFGGNKDDIFILQGSSITGYFYGEGGVNTLDLTSFAPEEGSIDVKLHIGQVEDYYRKNFFGMSGINKFLGRKAKADQVFITCNSNTSDIKFVDGQSGSEGFVDHINIHDEDCAYEMQIVVRSNTVIYNRALKGDFHYIVPYALGSAKVDFIYTAEALNLNNTFAFEYEPAQIKNVDVRNINVLNKTSHIITFNFSPMSDKEFNITISGASNPSYRLGNNTEIKVGNKGNLYMLENTNKSVDDIIKDYLVVANRLNRMSFFIQSLLSNETVAIGSGNYEVIHNNPLQKSHLVGNGGENVYVIDSKSKRFEIPLPEVVIYDLDVESSVDTIDLRNLVQQARGKFSNSFKLQIFKSANDLLLKATVTEVKPTEDLSVNKIIKHEYFTVRLKDGINWYNKTHVIMDNVPMRINLDNNEWSLKPLPLVFEKDKEVIIVTSQDVEENTELITPRKGGNYTFVRSNSNDLMITNAFDASITKNDLCSITLSKFYEEPKMGTLSIKFADKEVVLKEHQEEISSARDVNVVKKEYKDQVYNDVFNHTKSSPEVIMLSDQPMAHKHRHSRRRQQTRHRRSENITSNGTRPSSWINDLFSWVKSSVDGLFYSRAALPEETSNTASSIPQVDEQFAKASVSNSSSTSTTLPSDGTDKKQENGGFFRDNIDYVNANIKQMRERQTPVKFKPSGGNTILEMGDHYLSHVDFNGTIMLLDLLIRKVTGQKYISTVDQSISPLEAQGYALNITKGFEKVVEQAGLKSGVSMHRLNIDYMGMQKEITRKVMSGKFNEISGVLSSYIEKACPSREAGKLSPKKFDKFMIEFNKGLDITLNQSIQQILNNRNSTLEVNDVKEQQISLEPQSYLSNASVHSHSKVSTCLSDVGVTKLGNTLSK